MSVNYRPKKSPGYCAGADVANYYPSARARLSTNHPPKPAFLFKTNLQIFGGIRRDSAITHFFRKETIWQEPTYQLDH